MMYQSDGLNRVRRAWLEVDASGRAWEAARVGNALEEAPSCCQHGLVIVSERECKTSVSLWSRVTKISGNECSRIMAADYGDYPFTPENVVGRKGDAADSLRRRECKIHPEGGHQWAAIGELGIAMCGTAGEVPGFLKACQYNRRRLEGQPLVLEMLGDPRQQALW